MSYRRRRLLILTLTLTTTVTLMAPRNSSTVCGAVSGGLAAGRCRPFVTRRWLATRRSDMVCTLYRSSASGHATGRQQSSLISSQRNACNVTVDTDASMLAFWLLRRPRHLRQKNTQESCVACVALRLCVVVVVVVVVSDKHVALSLLRWVEIGRYTLPARRSSGPL